MLLFGFTNGGIALAPEPNCVEFGQITSPTKWPGRSMSEGPSIPVRQSGNALRSLADPDPWDEWSVK